MGAPAADVALRALRPGEAEAFLALLDGWEAPSGWRGRAADFFRRYVERDPTFSEENVWVAEAPGGLVSCVQIFPRALRLRGHAVPTGGIGSVFTRPEARGSGVASALVARALEAMRARGMELSLLFAARHDFYGRLGFRLWERPRPLWLRNERTAAPDPARRIERFAAARDLAAAHALAEAYGRERDGTVLRDLDFFRAQLAFAGNPDEDFLVARDAAGELEAFARGAVLQGVYLVTELARRAEPAAADALADLVLALMQPREPDPLAPAERPSAALRQMLVAPGGPDPALDAALARRGVEARVFEERQAMFAVLDPAGLARRIGEPLRPGEEGTAYVRRVLPPESLAFWPVDRF